MTISSLFRGLRIAAGIALLFALIAPFANLWASRWRPAAERYPLQGVDVGAEQGVIDWPALKVAGAQFAYLRATDGGQRDPRFGENWSATEAAGLRRGAIHVWSLCRSASDQADAFVTTVPRTADALPVAVELDYQPNCAARPDRATLIAQLRQFLQVVETHTGKPTLLKVSRAFEHDYAIADAIPRNLWSVQPFLKPDYFPRPWRMWQATEYRRLDGAEGPLHWDVVAP